MARERDSAREDSVSQFFTSLSPRFYRWDCVAVAEAAVSVTAAAGAEESRDGEGMAAELPGAALLGLLPRDRPFLYLIL